MSNYSEAATQIPTRVKSFKATRETSLIRHFGSGQEGILFVLLLICHELRQRYQCRPTRYQSHLQATLGIDRNMDQQILPLRGLHSKFHSSVVVGAHIVVSFLAAEHVLIGYGSLALPTVYPMQTFAISTPSFISDEDSYTPIDPYQEDFSIATPPDVIWLAQQPCKDSKVRGIEDDTVFDT